MHPTQKFKKIFHVVKIAFPYTIPVLTGFSVLGIAYGMLMQSKGYGPVWSGFISALAFCGSMQFVAITLFSTVFDPFQAFFLSIIVNARHIFYGIACLEKFKGLGWRRFFCIYNLCDESFSLISSIEPPEEIDKGDFYFAVSTLNWVYWLVGSVAGGIIGTLFTFNTKGLDFALTALFVVLLIEQLKEIKNRAFALIGGVCSIICLVIFKASNFVIPAMALLLFVLLVMRKISKANLSK